MPGKTILQTIIKLKAIFINTSIKIKNYSIKVKTYEKNYTSSNQY